MIKVCKVFFLTTLGYSKDNSNLLRVFKCVLTSGQSVPAIIKDGRGKYEKQTKFAYEAVKTHIQSYGPALPHYRREHAPNKRYLPSDITVKDMHETHIKHNQNNSKMTYSCFWQFFKTLNISMTQLGNEECELCTTFNLHKQICECDTMCSKYTAYILHKRKLVQARKEYKNDMPIIRIN